MWAEINNKLNSNPATSEDMLTSNFLGVLRYCSSESLIFHEILKGVNFINSTKDVEHKFSKLLETIEMGVQPIFKFWEKRKNSEGTIDEIDVLVEFFDSNFFIGFEMKYNSHLSSNDIDETFSEKQLYDNEQKHIKESRNQLLRYAQTFSKEKEQLDCFFIIWGKESMVLEIKHGIEKNENQNKEQKELSDRNIFLGLMSWEKTFEQLTKMQKPKKFPDFVILEDLLGLLRHKNLDGFLEFSISFEKAKAINREYFYEFKEL